MPFASRKTPNFSTRFPKNFVEYTSVGSHSFVIPARVSKIRVFGVGAGSRGGSSPGARFDEVGGAGGAGGYRDFNVTPGETLNLYVGNTNPEWTDSNDAEDAEDTTADYNGDVAVFGGAFFNSNNDNPEGGNFSNLTYGEKGGWGGSSDGIWDNESGESGSTYAAGGGGSGTYNSSGPYHGGNGAGFAGAGGGGAYAYSDPTSGGDGGSGGSKPSASFMNGGRSGGNNGQDGEGSGTNNTPDGGNGGFPGGGGGGSAEEGNGGVGGTGYIRIEWDMDFLM